MISKAGAHLLLEDAIEALKQRLIPLATLLTPNIPEAAALTGIAIEGYTDIKETLAVIA